jgi:hypothetical protein
VQITCGDSQGKLNGSVRQSLKINELKIGFMLKGQVPADLDPIAPVSLPRLPPYRFQGRLNHDGNMWSIKNLTSTVG